MVNREEVLQILLDRRDVTVFAPINAALRKHKARKQDDPKRDESAPMPSFYVLNLAAQKHMFPMAITPYLAGVAPLYLSVKEEEGKRKEYYVDNAKIIRQAEHRGTEGKTQFLYVIDELLEPYKPISGQPPQALDLLKQPSIYGLKETIDAFASRVTSEREKEVFSRVGNHTFFLPIGSVDGASSSKLQEIDTWSIENPADCEKRSVIHLLNAKHEKMAEIHRQLSEVYGENIMSEGMVRKWVRAFKNGHTNVYDEERNGRPSVITEDLVKKVDGKVRENRRFTISSLPSDFHLFLYLKKHLSGQRSTMTMISNV
ncbi:hypothetical protein AVEN_111844-1 [Araneus ventricosus]|uniref:Mos1 transposase HTH domain-containing protein n=1 Tax=Araneus ventricosus TaxID=182803 RepID=A0A4Y2C010_ARAVE|nr:hypothetical protein AVEN_111844-1 [Araneus ventricosus]